MKNYTLTYTTYIYMIGKHCLGKFRLVSYETRSHYHGSLKIGPAVPYMLQPPQLIYLSFISS